MKAINERLEGLGTKVRLEKGDGYFFFSSGEAMDWFDRTVKVPAVSSLNLEQWVDEYSHVKKLNQQLLEGSAADLEVVKSSTRSRKPRRHQILRNNDEPSITAQLWQLRNSAATTIEFDALLLV